MSNFRPQHIDISYDKNHNPINLKLSGETVEGSGVVTNASIDYPLAGADQTAVANLLSTIKTAKGR